MRCVPQPNQIADIKHCPKEEYPTIYSVLFQISLRTESTRYKHLDYPDDVGEKTNGLVQEQPVLGILYHPVQALVEILACQGAA
jgi:hypothetical protein